MNTMYPQKYKRPLDINIYKGNNHILIVPYDYSVGGFKVMSKRHINLIEPVNPQDLGDKILMAFEEIKTSPLDERYSKQVNLDFLDLVGYKSLVAFEKKYAHLSVVLTKNDDYCITAYHNISKYHYEINKILNLTATSTPEEIGINILDVFKEMDSYYSALKKTKPSIPRTKFETLSEMKISFEAPQDDKYVDEQDYGAAEIYQGYSYTKENADESVADMYFGIAAELDCDISPENTRSAFENRYGNIENFKYEPVEHSVFEIRAEIANAKIHHVLYLKKIDDYEILSCELVLKVKPAGKRLYSKITKDFENMVESCKVE